MTMPNRSKQLAVRSILALCLAGCSGPAKREPARPKAETVRPVPPQKPLPRAKAGLPCKRNQDCEVGLTCKGQICSPPTDKAFEVRQPRPAEPRTGTGSATGAGTGTSAGSKTASPLLSLAKIKIGIPECDDYLKLYLCYVQKLPPMAQGPALGALRRLVQMWQQSISSGNAAVRASIVKGCQLAIQARQKRMANNPMTRGCLKP